MNQNENVGNNNTSFVGKWIQPFGTVCGRIVNHIAVQWLMIVLIIINAIMMGIGTYDFIDNDAQLSYIWEVCDMVFLVIFTVELILQWISIATSSSSAAYDGWLLFDTIIIVLSWSLNGVSTIVRTVRVFRIVRLLTKLEALRNLLSAMLDVIPSISAIVGLLLLIMYIYAVLCTSLFGTLYADGITEVDYFSRLDISLFTLFQMMTLEWSDIVRTVCTQYNYAYVVFSTFLIFTSFILYSLIVAVVCDAVSMNNHNDSDNEDSDDSAELNRINFIQQRIHDITKQQSLFFQLLQDLQQPDTKNKSKSNDHHQSVLNRIQQRYNNDHNDLFLSTKSSLDVDDRRNRFHMDDMDAYRSGNDDSSFNGIDNNKDTNDNGNVSKSKRMLLSSYLSFNSKNADSVMVDNQSNDLFIQQKQRLEQRRRRNLRLPGGNRKQYPRT